LVAQFWPFASCLQNPLLLLKLTVAATAVIAPIDVGHLRKSLGDEGFTVGGFYLGETFANTGGIDQGDTYDGVLWTYLLADLHKAGLWRGLCFYTDAYRIHGRSITADDIGSLATVSNYEALPSTRLSELWFEQHMFNDHLTVRVGQLTADTEFLLSSGASHFLDSTFGWATLPTFDLPGGGPSYPLATPGVRLELKPNEKLSVKLAVYNGDPAGANCTSNPQVCNDDGLDFRLDSPPLLIAESGYKYNQDARLPGTVKIGAWNQFGTFHTQPGSGNSTVANTVGSVPIENDWGLLSSLTSLFGACRIARMQTPTNWGALRSESSRFLCRRRHHFQWHDPSASRRYYRGWLRLYSHIVKRGAGFRSRPSAAEGSEPRGAARDLLYRSAQVRLDPSARFSIHLAAQWPGNDPKCGSMGRSNDHQFLRSLEFCDANHLPIAL